jgi:hypothetical protein
MCLFYFTLLIHVSIWCDHGDEYWFVNSGNYNNELNMAIWIYW